MNKADYHPGWRELSWWIIHTRAKDRCELCQAKNKEPHPVTGSIVHMTTHHIDGDKKNNDGLNLLGLCQRCHLRLDSPYRAKRRQGSMIDIFMQKEKPRD